MATGNLLQRIWRWFASCCTGLKLAIFSRYRPIGDRMHEFMECDARCDEMDKSTFFAWQRNHMANERTFLAWCRTGISLIVFSFVIERFDLVIRELRVVSPRPEKFQHVSTYYMGLLTFILGAAIILLAGWRFFYIRSHINKGSKDFSVLPDLFLLTSVLGTVFLTFLFFVFLF
jgi:putative membrane protein